jgi:NAD-dependent deacetylase
LSGSQLRPHIVWFGEILSVKDSEKTYVAAEECDVCVVVGTSMQVSPANTIPFLTKDNSLIYYVDPSVVNFHIDKQRKPFFEHIKSGACDGMEKVKNDLLEIYERL